MLGLQAILRGTAEPVSQQAQPAGAAELLQVLAPTMIGYFREMGCVLHLQVHLGPEYIWWVLLRCDPVVIYVCVRFCVCKLKLAAILYLQKSPDRLRDVLCTKVANLPLKKKKTLGSDEIWEYKKSSEILCTTSAK